MFQVKQNNSDIINNIFFVKIDPLRVLYLNVSCEIAYAKSIYFQNTANRGVG